MLALAVGRPTETPFVVSGGAIGGRPVPGVPGVWPPAVEQSSSEAAGLQLSKGGGASETYFYSYMS